jgi:uncharacterized membrane protein
MVEIPNELKALLAIGITVVVTEILKGLSQKLNYDLSGYSAQITASVVGAILVLANALLTNVPAELAPIVSQIFILVVVVLGSFGAYKVIKG